MPYRILNKDGDEPPFLSIFIRERESDRIIRDFTFDEAVYITAQRVVRASAINADDTEPKESLIFLNHVHIKSFFGVYGFGCLNFFVTK